MYHRPTYELSQPQKILVFAIILALLTGLGSVLFIGCHDGRTDPRTTEPELPERSGGFVKVLQKDHTPFGATYRKLCVNNTVVYTAQFEHAHSVLRKGGNCTVN